MTLRFDQALSVPTWDEDIHQFVIFILDLLLTQSKHKAFSDHPDYFYVTPIWLDIHMIWHPYDLTSIWFGNFIPRKFCFSGQNIVFNLDSSLSIAQLVCLQILKLYSWPTTEVHVIHILKHIDLNNCMYIYMYKHIWKLTNIPFIGKADTRVLRRQHLSQKEMHVTVNNNQEQFMSWSVQWYCKRDNSVIQKKEMGLYLWLFNFDGMQQYF